MKNCSEINSKKITEATYELCHKANLYISKDEYKALLNAYNLEKSNKSKFILWQLLENLKIAGNTERPICQDTGIVVVFAEVGQNVHIDGDSLEKAINEGIKNCYKDNFFRKSIVKEPLFNRINTQDNSPAVIHTRIMEGNGIKLKVAIKGCGSENMSALKMLKPSDGINGIINFIEETVKKAGSNPCPPVRIGIGIGGTMEKSALLSKEALLERVKSKEELESLAPDNDVAKLELEILNKLNDLKIGAGGLCGDTTVFGINILTYPTHIAGLPVAININCHASRHTEAIITDTNIQYNFDTLQQNFEEINLDQISPIKINTCEIDKIKKLKAGNLVELSGEIITGRDAAHKQIVDTLNKGQKLPFKLKDKIIYYVGPCPAKENEIIGPAGPTTSGRMDKYTPFLMANGLVGSIGKGERDENVVNAIKEYKGVYFITAGGAACLLSQKIVKAEIIAYSELGPEAVYRLQIKDFPVIIAIDSEGNSII